MSLSVESAKVAIGVSSTFAILATLAGISAVMLVIISKTYNFLVFRLILYLSLFNLGFSVVLGLEVLSADVSKPADNETISIKSGWEGFCSFLGFADVYFNNSRTLMALLMSIYVFMMTVCKIEITAKKHEVTGLIAVIFVSFLFPWIPFVFDAYGLTGVWCWIKDPPFNTTNSAGVLGAKVGATIAPQFIMSVTCVVLIGGIIIVFCAGLGWTKESSLHDEHMTLTKKVLPLLIYPTMYAIVTIFNGANTIFISIAKYNNIALSITVVCVLQIVQLFLPLSLLLHARMRSMLSVTCCSKGKTAVEGISLQMPSSGSNIP